MDQNPYFSRRAWARAAGAMYMYIIVVGIWAEMFVRGKLVVYSDAAATAANILGAESIFRLAFSAELLHLAFDLVIAAILYVLFRPVHPILSMAAALSRVGCDLVLGVASISHFASLRLLKMSGDGTAFDAAQRQSLALLSLKLHGDAYSISLVYFSFACVALGILIARSRLLPHFIGWMMVLAGACYFVNSYIRFIAPDLASKIGTVILIPCFFAELFLAVTLLFRGVRHPGDETSSSGFTSPPSHEPNQ